VYQWISDSRCIIKCVGVLQTFRDAHSLLSLFVQFSERVEMRCTLFRWIVDDLPECVSWSNILSPELYYRCRSKSLARLFCSLLLPSVKRSYVTSKSNFQAWRFDEMKVPDHATVLALWSTYLGGLGWQLKCCTIGVLFPQPNSMLYLVISISVDSHGG